MAKNQDKKQMNTPEEKQQKKSGGLFRTLGRWGKRMFFGASKELDVFEVEKLESPTKLAVKTFFRRKLAVVALVVLLAMFLFVFIGPMFIPMDVNYVDALQANKAPNYSMMSVPKEMKDNIRDINGFADFTVGVSKDNNLYIWGVTKDALMKIDYTDFPEEIEEGKVHMAAAGSDHIIAITTDGKVVGWGANFCGQYGEANEADGYVSMARVLEEFKVGDDFIIPDLSKIQQLVCGYQVTALVYDNHLYMWGNTRTCLNMEEIINNDKYCSDVAKVALSNYNVLLLKTNGRIEAGKSLFLRQTATSSFPGEGLAEGEKNRVKDFTTYLYSIKNKDNMQTVVDIAATKNSFVILTEKGEMLVVFATEYREDIFPAIPEGEKVVDVSTGTLHLIAITDAGKAYGWGYNANGQAAIFGEDASIVYTGANQTYLVNENDELTASHGLRGYLFGTDNLGRDTFTRIVHGGRMTMTIGAVAVIVSSIIAIIVGCLAGYFGGWVDMLLMRVTEIFSAIPFPPFAMMLSFVIRNYPIDETTRILIIMIMLGLLSWTGLARMIRAQVLSEREKEFVIAAKSMGVKESRIAFKHILPNIISVILVSMTLDFAGCLLTESSLSYLGFGVQQPQPTWGNMLNGANNSIVIQNYWWQWVFPAIFLSIATISINIIGDTLRDVLDPKSSREK